MARSVELTDGAKNSCEGGHIVVTAHGFGDKATTLTIYATGTPGQPGTIEIGKASNKNNFAKAAISWYPGTQALKNDKITIRVTGPEGNSAEAYLYLDPYGNFSWGPCPA
jgi:hypothetical protein